MEQFCQRSEPPQLQPARITRCAFADDRFPPPSATVRQSCSLLTTAYRTTASAKSPPDATLAPRHCSSAQLPPPPQRSTGSADAPTSPCKSQTRALKEPRNNRLSTSARIGSICLRKSARLSAPSRTFCHKTNNSLVASLQGSP